MGTEKNAMEWMYLEDVVRLFQIMDGSEEAEEAKEEAKAKLGRLRRLRRQDNDVYSPKPQTQLPSRFLERLVESCPRITALDLRKTDCADLRPLSNLTELTTLWLGNTQVQDLGPLQGLTKLQRLYLDNTQVQDLTPLQGLTELQRLYLNNTQVQDLGPLQGLTELQDLLLDNTQVQDLGPLKELTELQDLLLGNTQVQDLRPLRGLTKLQDLSLINTQVHDLTPLQGLTNLFWLSLRNLQLDQLPRFCVVRIPLLSTEGTTYAKQPAALFRLPKEEILRVYYDQPKQTINEGKVIFLGESGVGKTHTIMRIQAHGEKKAYKTDSTPGVDIRPFVCGNGVTIRFWDFGGQEIMQSMHQCFLTERTCYVIVVSNRDPDQAMTQARKWLRTVAGFSNRVSVLLAVNQWHEVSERRKIDERALQELCPALTKIIFYSAEDDSQADFNLSISYAIQQEVQKLDSIQLELPKSWAAIREELLELKNDYITMADYRELCVKHGLGGLDNNMDAIRMWLLEWFNDMGVCFSYHKQASENDSVLQDYKILNPKWLTNGIYRIVNNGYGKAKRGSISTKDLFELLNGKDFVAVDKSISYKKRDVRYVLEVMRKFHRSYPIDENHEFIPETLLDVKPDAPAPETMGTPYGYTLRLTYLPESLLHRLMITMRDWNNNVLWRNGFQLHDGDTMLFIEKVPDHDRIHMELYRKPEARNQYCALFHETRGRLLQFIREMRLVVEEETIHYQQNDAKAEYALETLVKFYLKAKPDALPPMPSNRAGAELFPLQDLLFPFVCPEALETVKRLGYGSIAEIGKDLNAVCAVYPYASAETIEKLPKEAKKLLTEHPLVKELGGFRQNQSLSLAPGASFEDRLALLSVLVELDSDYLNWLKCNGVKTDTFKRREETMLEKKMISGINRDLFVWAEASPLYRKAVGAFDAERLAKALGPNETDRYVASYEIMRQIWKEHPELGLAPDYQLLSEWEHSGAYYQKYRDHTTHMFKVFLLGLYLYEKSETLRKAIDAACPKQDRFLSTWILTALYHDIGYLIETEKGTRDGNEAKFVYERLTEALSLPLTHLYPDVFDTETEIGLQRKYSEDKLLLCRKVMLLRDLEKKLASFAGFGATVSLTMEPTDNPLETYYNYLPQRREGRSYYDHGIVSACILLYFKDAVCEYLKDCQKIKLFPNQREVVDSFAKTAPDYQAYAEAAARAVALHNIKRLDEDDALSLIDQGVTIRNFQIPLQAEPIAYLLRLCDELQCWDRQRYDAPQEYTVGGDRLKFNTDAGRITLELSDGKTKAKLEATVENLFDPPVQALVALLKA